MEIISTYKSHSVKTYKEVYPKHILYRSLKGFLLILWKQCSNTFNFATDRLFYIQNK